MEDIKMTLEAIIANKKMSREEFAKEMGITYDRLTRLINDKSNMLARELRKIHEISGIPYDNIEI